MIRAAHGRGIPDKQHNTMIVATHQDHGAQQQQAEIKMNATNRKKTRRPPASQKRTRGDRRDFLDVDAAVAVLVLRRTRAQEAKISTRQTVSAIQLALMKQVAKAFAKDGRGGDRSTVNKTSIHPQTG